MRKRILFCSLFLIFVSVVLILHIYFVPSTFIKRPFKNLKVDDIERIKINIYYYEEKSYELSKEEMDTFLEILNNIKIKRRMKFKWNEKESPTLINEEGGIPSQALIELKSGKTITISANNVTIISGGKEIYKYRNYVIDYMFFEINDKEEETLNRFISFCDDKILLILNTY